MNVAGTANGYQTLTMKSTINGFPENVPQEVTIAQLIAFFHESDPSLIGEWNGRFVHPRCYKACTVQEGDRLEFIKATIGG